MSEPCGKGKSARHPARAPRESRSATTGLVLACLILVASACLLIAQNPEPKTCREVTATAYNSVRWQTQGDPTLTAFGDRLEPGMKALAVSRDLIPLGLGHGAEVEIEGMPGTWVVRDKMNRRFTERIDIYMGKDVAAAREWGRRRVTICW